jgi:Spy/CpxP family protein refolding chaperone
MLRIAALIVSAAIAAATPAWSQVKPPDATDMQALQAAVRADKRGYVASTLSLTDAEAKKFWPVYDAYQRSLDGANRQRSVALVNVVGQGQTIGDRHARSVLKDLVAADQSELGARRTMRDRVLSALPARKAIRYLQLEWKIRAAQDYDLATTIPLIGQ